MKNVVLFGKEFTIAQLISAGVALLALIAFVVLTLIRK